jgi:CMP-N,N'-diacetyllegionaminic acid synthase
MSFIGVIPARSGSKRVPRKNIAVCAGRPLLAYTCEAALTCDRLARVILSTDDVEIAELGQKLGVECPFMRPEGLATDATPMWPVLNHALSWCRTGQIPVTALVLLQPTSPLRTGRHISEAIALFEKTNAESVVSVAEVPHAFHPWKILSWDGRLLSPYAADAPQPRLRKLPPMYGRNGPAILITSPKVVDRGELYGNPNVAYVMAREDSVDIDSDFDFAMAEWLLERRKAGQ